MNWVAELLAVPSQLSCALLLAMVTVALYNLVTAPRLENGGEPRRWPRVSVLIPARDEARLLEETLPRLLRQDYPRFEVLVLDDESRDATAAVVTRLTGEHRRLRLLHGCPPPPGWLGKNWACHQLAEAARGQVLVFCDADVLAEPEALRHTVAWLERGGAVSALPCQRFSGWADRAVVPLVVQLPVLALLPLRLVGATRAPSLSTANGQWLAWRRSVYQQVGGHAAVRGEVVEDVALGRRVKASGERLLPLLAPRALSVRMYTGMAEVREGFRKNLYPLLGGRLLPLGVALLFFTLVALLPWIGVGVGASAALPALVLLLILWSLNSICFQQGWRPVVLHPLGSLLLLEIALASVRGHRRGTACWKGRPVVVDRLSPAVASAEVTNQRGRSDAG